MRPRNPGSQVNRKRDPQTPYDADLPQSQAGTCDFQGAQASNAKKQKQPGTQKLSNALRF